MKKKLLLLIALLPIFLTSCAQSNQLTYIEHSAAEEDLLRRIDSQLVEYELDLSEYIDTDTEVTTSLEYYENGEHIETINQISQRGVTKETAKTKISLGHTQVDEDTINLTLFSGGMSNTPIQPSKEVKVSSFKAFEKSIEKLEKDKDYYLLTYALDKDISTPFNAGFDQDYVKTYINEHDFVYVWTLKISDY